MNELIIALLNESDNGLTKTSIIKFVYLLDYYSAELTNGDSTLTELEWRFHKFGPYSYELDEAINSFEHNPQFSFSPVETNGHTFKLINSNIPSKKPLLVDLEIHSRVIRKILNDIKKFQFDLKGLLNFVYFSTEPMTDAKPGDVLDFSSCYTKKPHDFRHITIPMADEKKEHAKSVISNILTKRAKVKRKIQTGPNDEVYALGISALDSQNDFINFNGSAEIDLP